MARMFPGDDGTQPEVEIPDDPSEAWRRIKENALEEQEEQSSDEDDEGSTKDSDETDEEER